MLWWWRCCSSSDFYPWKSNLEPSSEGRWRSRANKISAASLLLWSFYKHSQCSRFAGHASRGQRSDWTDRELNPCSIQEDVLPSYWEAETFLLMVALQESKSKTWAAAPLRSRRRNLQDWKTYRCSYFWCQRVFFLWEPWIPTDFRSDLYQHINTIISWWFTIKSSSDGRNRNMDHVLHRRWNLQIKTLKHMKSICIWSCPCR